MNAIGGPELNDRQIARMQFRIRLFQSRQMTEDAAERLADRLALRDHDLDDRRCCIECKHRTADRECRVVRREDSLPYAQRVIRAVAYRFVTDDATLQRCPAFSFEVP